MYDYIALCAMNDIKIILKKSVKFSAEKYVWNSTSVLFSVPKVKKNQHS